MVHKRKHLGWRTWLVSLLPAVLFIGALALRQVRAAQQEAELGKPASPIVFVLSPDHGRELSRDDQASLAALLEAESGLAVEVRVAASPLAALEAFGARADVGLLNLFEYLLARDHYGVRARLQALRAGAEAYAGEILVRSDGPIQALGDLAGRSIAYVDPFSTSGFVFPATLLADAHVHPVAEFAGSHAEALGRLRAGRSDAAATFAGAAAHDSGLRVLAHTADIPNEPVFFRAGLAADKVARLEAAFARLAELPEGKRLLGLSAGITGFHAVEDAAYASALAAIRAAGKTVYDVVPEGVWIDARFRNLDYVP